MQVAARPQWAMRRSEPGPDVELPPDLSASLVRARVDGHARGALAAGLSSLAGAVLTLWALEDNVPRAGSLLWLAALAGVLFLRWHMVRPWLQAGPAGHDSWPAPDRLLARLRGLTAAHGAVWGALTLLLAPPWAGEPLEMLVMATGSATIAGAAVCLIYDPRAALGFVLPAALPLGLGLLAMPGPFPRAVSVALIMVAVLGSTMMAAARAVRRGMLALTEAQVLEAQRSRRIQQDEMLLRRVFDHVGEGLCMFDARHRLVAWNARMVQLMGLDPSIVRAGAPLRDLVVEMGRRGEFGRVDPEAEADRRVAAMARPGSGLGQRSRPDGSIVEMRRSPMPDGGFTMLAVDISARLASEAALARNRNMLSLLLASTEEGVWFIDNDQRTTDANPAMCRLLGVTREQILGRSIFDFVDEDNAPIFREQTLRRSQGLPGSYQIALRRSDGALVHCQNNPTPLFDDLGVKVGAVGLFADISPMKQAADALQRTGDQLKAQTRVLEATLQSLSQGVLAVDGQGRIEVWNQRAVELLQVPDGLLVPGRPVREVVAWQLANGYFDAYDDQLAPRSLEQVRRFVEGDDGMAAEGTYRRRRPDGRIIEVRVHRAPDGAQVRTYSDDTERIQAQAALSASETRFRTMADGAPAFIWQGDADGRALWFNQAWLSCLGLTLPQALQQTWVERMHPEDYAACQLAFEQAVLLKQPFTSEFRVRTADGREIWVADHGIPQLDAEHRLQGYVAYGWDVTSRKAAELSLRAARDEAERANRAKSDFLSRMSHELRTPLNAVLGFAQLIEREPAEPLQPLQRERVLQILRGGGHLLELINEVLDLARIESGALTMQVEPVHVVGLVQDSLQLVAPTARAAGVALDGPSFGDAAGPDAVGVLHTDATRLRQVLLNLLSNAIKYNQAGGHVRVQVTGSPCGVRLEVSDTGPGLQPEQQARLFQAFDRLGAEQGGVEGTGIGLALSKALVDLMGGQIGVRSTPGRGSTFWIDLPRGNPPALAAPASSPASPAAMPTEPATAGPLRRVLYIEDNRVNQIVVESMLARLPGVQVALASDPVEGLEMAFEQPPDLVLLDIQLPMMSGYEVLQRLRAEARTAAVPVIAVTANAMPEDLERAREAGFDDYVTKPLELARLLGAVSARLPPG